MKRVGIAVLFLLAGFLCAQEGQNIIVTPLKDNFFKLTSRIPYQVNFLAFVTEEGILLVDSGQDATGRELKSTLKTIAKGNDKVKYLINTHQHIDHTGGNLALAGEPVVIGTELLKTKLRSGSLVLNEFPDSALPQMIFSGSTALEFGGELIKIIALPGAHDSSDVIVHFVKSGVVCAGDIAFGMVFPSVDGVSGDMRKYPDVIGKLLKLIPTDATIITGHGKDLSTDELEKYQDMLVQTLHIVHVEMAKGKTLMAMQQEDILKDFQSFDGQLVNRGMMIYFIAIAGKNKMTGSLIEELFRVLEKNDGQEAVKTYYKLKSRYPGKYFFGENPLIRIGYWLLQKKRTQDAIAIFALCVNEFPDAWNPYDSLGEAYVQAGDKALAIANYEKSLQLNPRNKAAEEIIKKLKAEN